MQTPSVPTVTTGGKEGKKEQARDDAAPGTVGASLNGMLAQVNTAVTAAGAAGNVAGMEAGRDLAVAISSTQNVYEDDLRREMSGKISPALKTTLDQLQATLTQLQAMTKPSLQLAATGAEQVSNSLPYRPGEPRLKKFTPQFLVPAKDTYLVKMHFTGSFDLAAKPEFFPTLLIGNHSYKPVATSGSDLEFGVPVTDVLPPGTAAKQLQYVIGTLKMPWETSSMMGKHHTRQEDEFRLLLLALPSGPGTVKFMAKATRLTAGPPQRHTSAPFYQCSGRSCGKPDDINHLWTEPPDANCTVVPGSSSFDVQRGTGEWKKEFLGDGGDGVSYSVSTARHGAGTDSVAFTISFTETCGKEVPNNVGDDVALNWGDSKTIKAAAGTWNVSLDSFDGQHADFNNTNASNPFLKVTSAPDAVTLTAPDPATLVWPQP